MTTENPRIEWWDFAYLRDERKLFNNRMTLGRWIRDRGFPPGVMLGENSRRWRSDTVEAWEAAQIAAAEAASAAAKIAAAGEPASAAPHNIPPAETSPAALADEPAAPRRRSVRRTRAVRAARVASGGADA
jgi:hypothetical protein